MTRTFLGIVAVLALTATPAAVQAEDDPEILKLNWTTTSRDGVLALIQTATTRSSCEVVCTRDPGQQVLWKSSVCLATRDQVRFLSDDGERVLVIDPFPQEQGSWRNTPVITAYARTQATQQVLASDLKFNEKKLVRRATRFQWLAGDRTVPVPAPKRLENDPNQFGLQLIDGTKAVVSIDGKVTQDKPQPSAKKAPTKKKSRNGR